MKRISLSLLAKISFPIVVLFALGIAPALHASAQTVAERPCDIFASATPCVAAISTTRALYSSYKGPLYQVARKSGKQTLDIGLLPDGYADSATQDEFCKHTSCTITKLYDQSPNHNDLTLAPRGGVPGNYYKGFRGEQDVLVKANALPVTVHGHSVYGMAFETGMGYRNDQAKGTATGMQAEGVYMLTSALHLNHKCCFDFGNAEANNSDNQQGHMDAINIGCGLVKGPDNGPLSCDEPRSGLDMENGIPGKLPVPVGTKFATVMGVNDGQHTYAIDQGNAQTGTFTSTGTRPLPSVYQPMKMEGAIILGIGGDNSNRATGYFFEGVMTIGAPSEAVMKAVQANITAAKYEGDLKP